MMNSRKPGIVSCRVCCCHCLSLLAIVVVAVFVVAGVVDAKVVAIGRWWCWMLLVIVWCRCCRR